ncbi:hypothetical protein K438DRAFT_2097044 [Mycena galopus ATCC 62051]|nr:hypothetical protein K438DRAFT_2097044 [Mycena galopus ATCC 62051]
MPPLPTVTEICLDNITACLTQALPLLTELNDAFGPPFVQSIWNTIQGLINLVQVMENIHRIVYAIIKLHMTSETVGSLSPSMLDNIGKFMDTLHKTYAFIEMQQEGNRIKHLFRSNEMNKLLQACHAGMNQAMEIFEIQTGTETLNDIREFKNQASLTQKELMELIESLSDTSTLSGGSNSFSMLPSRPKIFHGREQELESVLKLLGQKSPRIAIMGGGGMGKTSLARAALHHPDTASKFEHRFFVSAEAATTSIELAALVGLHLGLNPGQDLTKAVVQYLVGKPSSLLILDNLETVWEPIQARPGVENLLSLLSEVEHLGLMITMRGAERPAKVQWSHPFLLPLQPLSNDAAQQTFMDITDNAYTTEEINQLLKFTDNMPLVVDLIAHLTNYEGLSNVLSRWKTEKTSMLSVGFDRQSNVDTSIALSLSSPRITSDSKELLSLLSILPNGLSEAELVQSKLGVPNILSCKAALQAISLVQQAESKRLLLLMPVREYIQRILPPSQSHIRAIERHFHTLLKSYKTYFGQQSNSLVNEITVNLANLHELLKRGLQDSDSNLADTVGSILSLNSFYRVTGNNWTPLIDDIPSPLLQLCDDKLEITLFCEVIRSLWVGKMVSQDAIAQEISRFHHISDPLLKAQFYEAVAAYFLRFESDQEKATEFFQKALESSRMCEDSYQECNILIHLGSAKSVARDYSGAYTYASAAQKSAKLSGDLYNEARATLLVSIYFNNHGEYKEGEAQLSKARDLIGLCGLSGGSLDHKIKMEQAWIHLQKSEYAEAQSLLSQELETTSPEKNAQPHALALLNVALVEMSIGGSAANIYHKLETARMVLTSTGHQMMIPYCSMYHAKMELMEGKFDSAKVKIQDCLASKSALPGVLSFCLEQLANIKAWPASSWEYKQPMIYLGHAYKSEEKLDLHKALLFLGDVFIANEDEETATSLYQVALAGFTSMDVHQSRAECMLHLGDIENRHGHTSEALTLWMTARPLFVRSLQARDVAQIDSRIATVEKAHQKALMQLETLHAPVQPVREDSSNIEDNNLDADSVEEHIGLVLV